jgi:peptidoglycan hydrolase CwlO-like protein
MNECKCDQCSRDITGDNTYCQKCYDSLVDEIRTAEDKINDLEGDSNSADEIIANLERRIDELTERITQLNSKES